MKAEMAILGSLSPEVNSIQKTLIIPQGAILFGLCGCKATLNGPVLRTQELYESGGRRPGRFPVTYSPYALCGRKATLNETVLRTQELFESGGGRVLGPRPR